MAKPARPSDPNNATGEPRTFFVSTGTASGRSLFQTERISELMIDVIRKYVHAGNSGFTTLWLCRIMFTFS